jgi:hypothetical protein
MNAKLSSLLVSLVCCACASDFNPTVVDSSMHSVDPSEDPAEDDSPSEPEDDDAADEDTAGDDSTTGGSAEGGGSDSDSGTEPTDDGTPEPTENPGPGEPCNPFEAFGGDAPCDGDPANPTVAYTCVPASVSPIPEETVWEFRCVAVVDAQGNGSDITDPCSDAGGSLFAGCMNSYCLGNGLSNTPETDVYQNHPPVPEDDACPFVWNADESGEGGYFVKACCSDFCDAAHPCDAGWTCITNQGHVPATLDGEAVGACVWQ